MITLEEYFGPWHHIPDLTQKRMDNARIKLLPACSALEKMARLDGVIFPVNPITLSGISGECFGGFRPQSCRIGAWDSRHKEGLAVDRYDPAGHIDAWCMEHLHHLKACGIWVEEPADTFGWSHWQCVSHPSGKRVFVQ